MAKQGQKVPHTIKDIAKLANCSIRTVSRVLNNSADVKQETRDKILKITNELAYTPDPHARSLKTKRKHTIGVIHNGITSDVNRERIETITKLFNTIGSALLINYAENITLEEEIINNFKVRADALIILTNMSDERSNVLDHLMNENYPFILIDPRVKVPYPSIYINRIKGYRNAVSHLVNQGKTKIALFINNYRSNERIEGYKKGLDEHKIPFDQNLIIHTPDKFLSEFHDIEELYLEIKNQNVDGVICHNDKVALSLMYHLNQKEIKIPEDTAIIGYDNDNYTQFATSPLTTIAQPGNAVGLYIYEQIHNKLEYDCPIESKVFDTYLVIRKSS